MGPKRYLPRVQCFEKIAIRKDADALVPRIVFGIEVDVVIEVCGALHMCRYTSEMQRCSRIQRRSQKDGSKLDHTNACTTNMHPHTVRNAHAHTYMFAIAVLN